MWISVGPKKFPPTFLNVSNDGLNALQTCYYIDAVSTDVVPDIPFECRENDIRTVTVMFEPETTGKFCGQTVFEYLPASGGRTFRGGLSGNTYCPILHVTSVLKCLLKSLYYGLVALKRIYALRGLEHLCMPENRPETYNTNGPAIGSLKL